MKLRVGVLFGGATTEHDISIITGLQVLNNLDHNKYDVVPLYLTRGNEILSSKKMFSIEFFKTKINKKRIIYSLYSDGGVWMSNVFRKFKFRKKIDLIFNCTHGFGVEDGTASGFLNYLKISYSSPNVMTSSICQDKDFTKKFLKTLDIDVLDHITIKDGNIQNNLEKLKDIDYPVIIKPAHLGSSIGIKVVHSNNELLENLRNGFIYDNKVILEKYLDDSIEYSIAVYRRKQDIITSRIEVINKKYEIFDFKEKYIETNKLYNHNFIDEESNNGKKIIEIAKQIYDSLEMKGIVRIDFIEKEKLYVNEINTVPGSMAYYLFKNISFKTLLDEQVRQMLYEEQINKRYKQSFQTSVLNNKYKFYKK